MDLVLEEENGVKDISGSVDKMGILMKIKSNYVLHCLDNCIVIIKENIPVRK